MTEGAYVDIITIPFGMNLIAAINLAADGEAIVSNADRTYKLADMEPIVRIGKRAICFRTCGMTESERKGTWQTNYHNTFNDVNSNR